MQKFDLGAQHTIVKLAPTVRVFIAELCESGYEIPRVFLINRAKV